MIKLAAGVVFYNDYKSLKRCLDSLSKFEAVIAIDGKYTEFKDDNPLPVSSDGSWQLSAGYPNTITLICSSEEPYKRNMYLQVCKEYDIQNLLIIDSDEYVKSMDDDFIARLPPDDAPAMIYGIKYEYTEYNYTLYPRLWHRPYEFEYTKAHNFWRHKPSGNIFKSSPKESLMDGLIISGDDKLRDEQYLKQSYAYQKWLIEHERPIRSFYRQYTS